MSTENICLTQYSHGGGCGCKIAPNVLETILHSSRVNDFFDPHLLVGNETRDDAAVYDIGNGQAIISTTDFFMPIVDDPFDFGRIAATNAISDIYAMGGRPIMAIAILGWPINTLPAEVAAKVIDGGRSVCQQAGISLAGGHSIDCPEPVFGLAVTGIVPVEQVKRNNTAISGCHLLLSKPLGIGVLTTAEKKGVLLPEDRTVAVDTMCKLNQLGQYLSTLPYVKAMTDITGFGLLGHLTEICQGADLRAQINFDSIPTLPNVLDYISKECVPGGTYRNYSSYGHLVGAMTKEQRDVLCDPQTSGGLLIAVEAEYCQQIKRVAQEHGECLYDIGQLYNRDQCYSLIEINS